MESYIENSLKEQIDKIKKETNSYSVGRISKISDYIIEVRGLEDAAYYEEVQIQGGSIGYVNAISPNSISVAVVKKAGDYYVGDSVVATGKEFKAKYCMGSLGHIVDMFGRDKLADSEFENLIEIPMENPCVPIRDRSAVCRPLRTGISGIDLIFPIGRGQRQLIIGDKKTGKTQIALDTIANQASEKTLCIYVAIGKTKKNIREIYYELSRRGAMNYTIIICAFNDDMPPVLSLTPYAALAIAETYMNKGQDVLVVLDDMKRHADAYREISLLTGKAPGREAYPTDIFYAHARLLEKGCQHKDGGSITILPITETKGEDVTDYISTNLISITDGQIVLSKKSFDKGQKPAINYGLSVSRLGGAVQTKEIKGLGSKIRRDLLSYLERKEIYELSNIDEMNEEMQNFIKKGSSILENLNQYKYSPKKEEEIIETFKEFEKQDS